MATAGDQRFATQLVEQLASAGVVVKASDGDDRITSWNAAAAATFGWPADEVIGRDVVDLLIEPDRRDEARASLAAIRETGKAQRGRYVGVRRDGSRAV